MDTDLYRYPPPPPAPTITPTARHRAPVELGELGLTAKTTVTRRQRGLLLGLVALVVVAGVVFGFRILLAGVISLLTVLYFADLVFNAVMVTRTLLRKPRPPMKLIEPPNGWPMFTVLCPMYKETSVLRQFVAAIEALDYPHERLQVLLLLEEDDTETVEYAESLGLPSYFEIIVTPDGIPKTKPKACNYGLSIAQGEYTVIFDAEDKPEADQLKKAVVAFRRAPGDVACLQARLNFYNVRQNVLTRLFTIEYSLWFDLMLEGLQRLNGPIPLGGTSNHFRTDVLQRIGGWDPWNVTEDCDLGIRLYKSGFRTGMLDSTTFEEANSQPVNWVRQRSRWVKGYLQTLLVHLRGGWNLRDPHLLTFLLVVGGKVIVNFVNPIMWALTASYFLFRSTVGDAIESVYPAGIFYLAAVTLLVGNLLFIYTFLLGPARRGAWDLVKYALLAPAYWLMMSIAAFKAGWQLIRNPHYWEKTVHGLHLTADEKNGIPA